MRYQREKLENVTGLLAKTALGVEKADLVLRRGKLVNVCSGEVINGIDVAIKGSRIAYVGHDAAHTIDSGTQVVDLEGMYIAPGFLDGHVHVESSMVTLSEFARAVLPHGTTGIFWDPHEVANVLGLEGVRLMLEEARKTPLMVFGEIPSCVPSCAGFETAGASITAGDVAAGLSWENVIGLGEVMNYPAVISGDPAIHQEIAEAIKAGKAITGHYASPDLGPAFQAYAASGIWDCHEGVQKEDALARVRAGMYALIRFGSAWHDVAENIKAFTEDRLDTRHMCLVSDDRHPNTILNRGHMDDVLREAIANGVPPLVAIQMATLNTAENFGVSRHFGSVSPSRFADILILEDLVKVKVHMVIAAGKIVAQEGRLLVPIEPYSFPDEVKDSIHLGRVPRAEDFKVPAGLEEKARARVIRVIENHVLTKHLILDLPVEDGLVVPSKELDVVKLAVLERHRATGNIGLGFVQGLRFRKGALASTVAHDSHNLMVCGTSDEEMTRACEEVVKMKGGIVVVAGNQVLARVELPVAGLVSDESVEAVARKVAALEEVLKKMGCDLNAAMMTFSLLALVVLPELRLTDLGLIDTVAFQKVPLLL